MEYVISNGQTTVSIQTVGAELTGIKNRFGAEYLWQSDPEIWNAQSPILFPIIGKLTQFRYELDGEIYQMGWHGFACASEFNLMHQSSSQLDFCLKSSAETLGQYPFKFELNVSYRLEESRLSCWLAVRNCGVGVMPFSIGAHPGFNLPGPLDECFLEFEQAETIDALLLGEAQLLSGRTRRLLTEEKILPLTRSLFAQGALIFENLKSKSISLCCRKNSRRVSVQFSGFPYVGLWSKPGASFVCIEPWFGVADPEIPYGEFLNKPGIQKLESGHVFACRYCIEIS